jgi:hypothetical protein
MFAEFDSPQLLELAHKYCESLISLLFTKTYQLTGVHGDRSELVEMRVESC